MLTDQIWLGNINVACEEKFIRNNFVTHIVNTNGKVIPNVWDSEKQQQREVKEKM